MSCLSSSMRWHWKITPEQIERIKANDRETVNSVYLDNLLTFRKMAFKYCRNARKWDCVGDCVNQIYVDLTDYDFTDTKTLFWSIYKSFRRACMSVRVPVVSLDKPLLDEEGATFGDMIGVDGFEELERKEHECSVLEIIAEQTQLTDRQRDELTAFAFGIKAYRGLYAEEFRQAHSS